MAKPWQLIITKNKNNSASIYIRINNKIIYIVYLFKIVNDSNIQYAVFYQNKITPDDYVVSFECKQNYKLNI